jgi:hypothetical protein
MTYDNRMLLLQKLGRSRHVQATLVMGLVVILGYIIHASHAATLVGDLNGDGVVNVFDLSTLLSNWGTVDPSIQTNLGRSTTEAVGIFDLSVLLSNWGQTGSTPTATPTPTPTATPTPAVAFVQADDTGTFNGNDTSIGSGTYNQVLAHNTGLGHTVVLIIQTLTDPGTQTDTVQSISSGMGTFHRVNSYNDLADNEIWICTDTTGAADTMTVNTSTNAWDAFAIEFNQPATGFTDGGGRVDNNLGYLSDQSLTVSPGAAGNVVVVQGDTLDAYTKGPAAPWTFYNNGYWDFDNGTSAAWQVASSSSPVTVTWQTDGGLSSIQGVVVDY